MAYTDIDKPTDYFNTLLYTGDGTSSRALTGLGFQPDMVWTKRRSTSDNHHLFDSVRVVSSVPQRLFPNLNNAEDGNFGSLDSFDSDGFTVGSNVATNSSGETFVAWNWLASNTTASNTDGSITSTVSANTTSGFSIVSYTGTGANATVGHGLGVKPDLIIAKNRTDAVDWYVYHSSLGATKNLRLNQTFAELTESAVWDNTEPTTSVISVNNANGTNGSSDNLIFYCMTSKKGFSKFGSYTGNGSTDGTFVYTGFSPSFVIRKRTDSADSWQMHDNKRDTFNVTYHRLLADDSGSEYTSTSNQLDFLSNGFKCRASNGGANGSGGTYIYMCFAENPFVTSTGIPTVAR
jgi:hypothetical protein